MPGRIQFGAKLFASVERPKLHRMKITITLYTVLIMYLQKQHILSTQIVNFAKCSFILTIVAVLTAGAPDQAAFMADESMQALPGLMPLQYTLGFYLQYMDQIKQILKILQKGNL